MYTLKKSEREGCGLEFDYVKKYQNNVYGFTVKDYY